MRRFIVIMLTGAIVLCLVAGCCGPRGSARREVEETRRTRDKEVKEMDSTREAPK